MGNSFTILTCSSLLAIAYCIGSSFRGVKLSDEICFVKYNYEHGMDIIWVKYNVANRCCKK